MFVVASNEYRNFNMSLVRRRLLLFCLPLGIYCFLAPSKDIFDLSHYLPIATLEQDTGHPLHKNSIPDPNRIRFGNLVEIKFDLPSSDIDSAKDFLSDSSRLVDTLWDKGKYEQLDQNNFRLLCKTMQFPVFGTFHPMIELEVTGDNGRKSFRSTRLSLHKEEHGEISETNYLQSVEVKFEGTMFIDASELISASSVIKGFVEYKVDGKKPRYALFVGSCKIFLLCYHSFLRLAPAFLLNSAYKIFHDRVMQYTQEQVSSKFIESFSSYTQIRAKKSC